MIQNAALARQVRAHSTTARMTLSASTITDVPASITITPHVSSADADCPVIDVPVSNARMIDPATSADGVTPVITAPASTTTDGEAPAASLSGPSKVTCSMRPSVQYFLPNTVYILFIDIYHKI